MTRPESEPELPQYHTVEEEVPSLFAKPLNLRKQAIADFDAEFRIDQKRINDARFELRHNSSDEVAESLLNAQALVSQGEFALARDLYRTILKVDSTNELAIRGAAECARKLGQHEEAIRILKKLVDSHRSFTNFLLLADELYGLEYNEDALEMYFQVLKSGIQDERILFNVYKNLGNIQLRLGDLDAAEESYNKAFTIDPDSDALLTNYGSLALYRGQMDHALARFRDAVSMNDRNDKAWVGLAMIHRQYGDVELAWANLEKALDLNIANESAVRLLCEWAMKDNEIEVAIRHLDRFTQRFPDHALISMWHAKFLYFSGRLDVALLEIEKALYLDPLLDGAMEVLTVIREELAKRRAHE